MSKLQKWAVVTVLAVVAALALGWFLLVSPKRGDAESLRNKTASEQQTATRLQGELAVLKAQAAQLPRQQAKLAAISRRLPGTPSLPSLVRSLSTASDSAGVVLDELSPSVPVLASTQATASATGPGTPAAPGTGAAPGTTPVPGGAAAAANLQVIPVSVVVKGGYYQLEQFLSNVEALQRSFLVRGFDLTPDSGTTGASSKTLVLKIKGAVFMDLPAAASTPTTTTPAAGTAAPAK